MSWLEYAANAIIYIYFRPNPNSEKNKYMRFEKNKALKSLGKKWKKSYHASFFLSANARTTIQIVI